MTIRWSDVQSVYSADLQEHWARSQALGLQCPIDDFADLLRFVDWGVLTWVIFSAYSTAPTSPNLPAIACGSALSADGHDSYIPSRGRVSSAMKSDAR